VEKIKKLILGKGFIGTRFNGYLKDSVLSDKRIISIQDVKDEIEKHDPDIIINCIGKTGRPNIDWCETHKGETMFSNVVVPAMIAQACEEKKIRMVHIGSGCIFEGDNNGKGFTEDDTPNFYGSFYSRTKIISEQILKEFEVLILRIRMPIDDIPNERNLITKLLGYEKLINIPNSITIIPDLLMVAEKLLEKNQTGIFNVVNSGHERHKELLNLYNELSDTKKEFSIITGDELDHIIKAGRSNCILSINKLADLGIKMPNIQDSIKNILKKYIEADK